MENRLKSEFETNTNNKQKEIEQTTYYEIIYHKLTDLYSSKVTNDK